MLISNHPSGDGYPTPGLPGGPGTPGWDQMHRAVYGATPTMLEDHQEHALTSIALRAQLAPSDAAGRIRAVYGATPSGFGARDNAIVMGAALVGMQGNPGSVVRDVYGATPSSFGASQNAAVMAVALLAGTGTSSGSIVRGVYGRTPSSYTPDEDASAMMAELIERGGRPQARWEFHRLLSEIR